jgi:hypothetical protein
MATMPLNAAQSRVSGAERPGRPRKGADYEGSRFADVWRVLASTAYERPPEARITLRDVLRLSTLRGILQSARRTLRARDDLLPHFEKLVHPVGICLRGTWHITESTSYTGLFRAGSEALIIARASENMGETRPGRLRFLGLAGKLYPTSQPRHDEPLRTANFVMNENLLGSHTQHLAHATFTTDLLPFRLEGTSLPKFMLGALVTGVFALADRTTDFSKTLRRQLYPVAQAGEDPGHFRAPRVMLLVGSPENRRVDAADLREELDIRHHPGGLRFEIHVSDERSYLVRRGMRRIGEVVFTDSVTSDACDHRLHFRHPPYRERSPRE